MNRITEFQDGLGDCRGYRVTAHTETKDKYIEGANGMYDRFETHHIFPNSYPEGGVAPSRHSLAKFEYLEKQRRQRSMQSERGVQEIVKITKTLIEKGNGVPGNFLRVLKTFLSRNMWHVEV